MKLSGIFPSSSAHSIVVIIFSEETVAISVAIEGMLKRHLNGSSLDRLLHSELIREEENIPRVYQVLQNVKMRIRGSKNEKDEKNS